MKEDVGLTHSAHFAVKIAAFVFVTSVVLLYFGKQLTDEDQQLLFFNYDHFIANITTFQSPPQLVEISSNEDKSVVREEVQNEEFVNAVPSENNGIPVERPKHELLVERFGIVDENGVMSNEFRIGDFGNEIVEILSKVTSGSEDVEESVDVKGIEVGFGVTSFAQCPENMTHYIPCSDNFDVDELEKHRLEKGRRLDCLIPLPKDYKRPVRWPKSREQV